MKKKQNNGFTLVELLAVIVILAIILVIAVPKVMSVIEDSKKATLESTAKMIASAAEKAKVQNTVLGKTDAITCDSVAKINNLDYDTCDIDFEDNKALVTIKGKGKFAGLNVCSGDKTNAEATDEECATSSETGGCDTLYWDGSTANLISVVYPGDSEQKWYKVSDNALSLKEFETYGNYKFSYYVEDNFLEENWTYEELLEIYNFMGTIVLGDALIWVIPTDNYVPDPNEPDFIFPEAGIYFPNYNPDYNVYVTSFAIPGYTGFPHSENCGH